MTHKYRQHRTPASVNVPLSHIYKGEVHFWPFDYYEELVFYHATLKQEKIAHRTINIRQIGHLASFKGGFVFLKIKNFIF